VVRRRGRRDVAPYCPAATGPAAIVEARSRCVRDGGPVALLVALGLYIAKFSRWPAFVTQIEQFTALAGTICCRTSTSTRPVSSAATECCCRTADQHNDKQMSPRGLP
jgi:hypothetical protein